MSYTFRDRLLSTSEDITKARSHRGPFENQLLVTKSKPPPEDFNRCNGDGCCPRGLLRFRTTDVFGRSSSEHRYETFCLWKDVGIVSASGFFFNVIYFGSLFNFFSLIQPHIALVALVVNFTAQIVAGIFLSAQLRRIFGCKITLVICYVPGILFAAAQFYPRYSTLIPAGLLLGSGAICSRVTSSLYGSLVARYRAESSLSESVDSANTITVFVLTNFVPIAGGILGTALPIAILPTSLEATPNSTFCGSSFCDNLHKSIIDTDPTVLNSVFVAFSGISPLLIAVFLNGRSELEEVFSYQNGSTCQQWTVVASELSLTNVRLPFSCFVAGLVWSYSVADLTLSFSLCSIGPSNVSPLSTMQMSTFFATICLVSFFCRFLNPNMVIVFANVFCSLLFVWQIYWTPSADTITLYFFEAFFGIVNGLYLTINHFEWGTMRSSGEATYSVYSSLCALGSVIGFSWTNHVCTVTKLYVYIACLAFSTLLYAIAFFRERTKYPAPEYP